MKAERLTIMLTTLLAFTVLFTPAFSKNFPSSSETYSLFLKYEVEEVFAGELKHIIKITNPWQKTATGKLIVPLVKNQTSRHYTILYNFSVEGGQFNSPLFLNDSFGNVYLCWEGVRIPPKRSCTVELDYFVLSFSVKYTIDSSLVSDYDVNSKVYKLYTQPEELIQSDNPKIIGTAHIIVGDEENPHKKAQLIYNFVTKHLNYKTQSEEKGALWALENGEGDCSEYSYLFVALCRAAGVPARVQAGFAFPHVSAAIKDGHMWAEYYLENYGWITVDAAWRIFGQTDHRHFSSIQSIPEFIPYANFYLESIGDGRIEDEQTIQLKQIFTSRFSNYQFVEKVAAAVRRIKEAEFAALTGKILGIKILFPSEVEDVENKILECKVCLQNAVEFWIESPQTATHNVAEALGWAEEASKRVLMLVAKVLTLYFAVILFLAAFIILLRPFPNARSSISHIASLF